MRKAHTKTETIAVVHFFIVQGIHTLRCYIISAERSVVIASDIQSVGSDHSSDVFAVFKQLCHHCTVQTALNFQIFLCHIRQCRRSGNIGFRLPVFAGCRGRFQRIEKLTVLFICIILFQIRRHIVICNFIKVFHFHDNIIAAFVVFFNSGIVEIGFWTQVNTADIISRESVFHHWCRFKSIGYDIWGYFQIAADTVFGFKFSALAQYDIAAPFVKIHAAGTGGRTTVVKRCAIFQNDWRAIVAIAAAAALAVYIYCSGIADGCRFAGGINTGIIPVPG